MNSDLETDEEILKIRLEGNFDIGVATDLVDQVRAWESAVEFDLSAVESIDLAALQFLLVVFQSKRRLNQPVAMRDSEAGILRSTLELTGLKPEAAGLSARLTL
jgi:ABC-type transporter Mla MlaB component